MRPVLPNTDNGDKLALFFFFSDCRFMMILIFSFNTFFTFNSVQACKQTDYRGEACVLSREA